MKKILFICSFLTLGILSLQSQSLDSEYLGCSSFKVTFSGGIPQNLYTALSPVNCGGSSRLRAGAYIPGSQFQLQKKNSTGFTVVTTIESGSNTHTFNNLSSGIYKVRLIVRMSNGNPVFPQLNPCGGAFVGWNHSTGFAEYHYSDEIEIGTPTVSNIIFPTPTAGNPGSICFSKIDDANELLLLNGETSYGERGYHLSVWKNNTATGVEADYDGTGWVDGKISIVNLKDLLIGYEPGYTYTVQLALSQMPCNGWVSVEKKFKVISGCRETDDIEVKLYPNPTSDAISFDGLETWATNEIEVNMVDVLGRSVLNTTIAPYASLSVADLTPGNYILTLKSGDNFSTQKVVIER